MSNGAPPGAPRAWLDEAMLADSDDCIDGWPYAVNSSGYPSMEVGGKVVNLHRTVCRLVHGDPPTPVHEAAHSCGNRLCLNRRHLRWATRAENKADELLHGTRNRGERNGRAVLTDEECRQVLECRGDGRSQREVAMQFNISQDTVSRIFLGRRFVGVSRTPQGSRALRGETPYQQESHHA